MTKLLPALYIPKGYVSQLGRYARYEQLMVGCVEPGIGGARLDRR